MKKKCHRCGQVKPYSEFFFDGVIHNKEQKARTRCHSCTLATQRVHSVEYKKRLKEKRAMELANKKAKELTNKKAKELLCKKEPQKTPIEVWRSHKKFPLYEFTSGGRVKIKNTSREISYSDHIVLLSGKVVIKNRVYFAEIFVVNNGSMQRGTEQFTEDIQKTIIPLSRKDIIDMYNESK